MNSDRKDLYTLRFARFGIAWFESNPLKTYVTSGLASLSSITFFRSTHTFASRTSLDGNDDLTAWSVLLIAAGVRTLVLPFENLGGDPAHDWLGGAFEEAVSVTVRASPASEAVEMVAALSRA